MTVAGPPGNDGKAAGRAYRDGYHSPPGGPA